LVLARNALLCKRFAAEQGCASKGGVAVVRRAWMAAAPEVFDLMRARSSGDGAAMDLR